MYQNGTDVLMKASVSNDGEPLEDVEFRLTSEPPFFRDIVFKVDRLDRFDTIDLKTLPSAKVELDHVLMESITERMVSTVRLTAYSPEGTEISSGSCDTVVLPFDDWPGCDMPETIVSFITPNATSLSKVRASASDILREWGMSPSLEGYQGDPNRVLSMAAAVYAALERMNITYVNPPAGFEASGQRIRLPDDVLSNLEGTCIDLTVLYASVLESIGLNTMVFIVRGHAFAGFWLTDDCQSEMVTYDSSMITRRIRNNDVRAVECTMFTNGSSSGFDRACDSAMSRLEDYDSFICTVDVRRSRSVITPLPVRRLVDGKWIVEREERDHATRAPVSVGDVYGEMSGRKLTKVDKWKFDLLDLTGRNNMINMKQGSKVTPLLIADVPSFEDALARGEEFSLMPKPQEWDSAAVYGRRPFETELYIGNYSSAYGDEVSRRRIRTPMTEGDTESVLKSIYRLMTKEIEESGCNPLFIALGILRWYEGSSTGTARYAPLILLPAEMRKKQRGYTVKKLDEETVFNVTLQEKLRQDFDIRINIDDPLPADDDGVNVDWILQSVRKAIDGKEGWEVLEGAALGIFSFNQLVMLNDLDRNIDRLRENPVVDCLIEGTVYPGNEEIDEDPDPYGLCLTVPADGSQIRAVRAAGEGRSFVLHGPPGTGKSQTITNMISNALFQGKTVLFVAEKRAALEVVQKRLKEDVGIDNHCLELHSNKAEKGKVLEQLRRAVQRDDPFDEAKRDELMQMISNIRDKLDRYVADLHRDRSWGHSAFDCISLYGENDVEGCIDLRFSTEAVRNMSPGDEVHVESGTRMACQAYRIVAGIDCPEIREIGTASMAASIKDDVMKALDDTYTAAGRLMAARDALRECDLPVDVDDTGSMTRLIGTLSSIGPEIAGNRYLTDMPSSLSEMRRSASMIRNTVSGWTRMGLNIHESNVSDMIGRIGELEGMLSSAESRGYLTADSVLREMADTVGDLCTAYLRIKPDMDTVSATWRHGVYAMDSQWNLSSNWSSANNAGFLAKGKAKKAFLEKVGPMLRTPGAKFESLSATIGIIDSISGEVLRLEDILSGFESRFGGRLDAESGRLESLEKEASSAISAARSLGLEPSVLPEIYGRVMSSRGKSEEYIASLGHWNEVHPRTSEILGTATDISKPEAFMAFRDRIIPHLDGLYDWTAWNHYSSELRRIGIPDAVDIISSGAEEDLVVHSVLRAMYKEMIELCRRDSESLRMFNGPTFEKTIEQFRRLDRMYTDYSRKLLKHRLSSNIPRNMDRSVSGTESNILHTAIHSSRMRKSIRTLIGEIPNILPKICPCMLMSPQSVSKYITMDFPRFDLVIFDESSQITTCKAIGALGRSKAAVIAGDEKQLPPTSFFQKRNESEDDEDMVDVDSFLDDCLALNMPQSYLEWHYRSRHESLIAFSNRTYYDDRMLTFPSPNDQEAKVSIRFTGGTYERRKSCNVVEARAVVEEIRRRVLDRELRKQSIGVIAFSIKQQNCIDDMLEEMKKSDNELYAALNDLPEKCFIKNLETVQGDERDIILFSIGYGPLADGTVPQNFGPINRDGGGRRLNVAVSRARSEMVVFTSMRSTDIKITPMSKGGVMDLRGFLEFAENGGRFDRSVAHDTCDEGPEMIRSIADRLSSEGYTCHFDVGASGFKVDVAVVDPDDPDEYILGILADGESYRKSSNTRDREYARADVLGRLGWNLAHVWSMEWRYNGDRVVSDLIERLSNIREGRDVTAVEGDGNSTDGEENVRDDGPDIGEVIASGPPVESSTDMGRCRPYVEPHIPSVPVPQNGLDDRFIREVATVIIGSESPVNEEYLLRLFSRAVGIKRLSEKNRTILLSSIRRLPHEDRGPFTTYWCEGTDPESYRIYRVGDRDTNRDIMHVPLREIENAIVDAVEQSGSLNGDAMVQTVCRLLGYNRAGTNVRAVIADAVAIAEEDDLIGKDGDRYLPV